MAERAIPSLAWVPSESVLSDKADLARKGREDTSDDLSCRWPVSASAYSAQATGFI